MPLIKHGYLQKLSAALAKCTSLLRLDLRGCFLVESRMPLLCDGLAACTSLKELDLADNLLGSLGIIELRRALRCTTNLVKLNLANCGINDGIEALCADLVSHTHLQELNLAHNMRGQVDLRQLKPVSEGQEVFSRSLKVLNLSQCGLDFTNSRVPFACTTSLEDLDLSHNLCGNWSFEDLTCMQAGNRGLTRLILAGCDIFEEGVAVLCATALACTLRLQHLDLSYNCLRDAGAQHVATLLDLCFLEELVLVSCDIEDEGRCVLGQAMRRKCQEHPSHAMMLVGIRLSRVAQQLGLAPYQANAALVPNWREWIGGWSNACVVRMWQEEVKRKLAICMLTHRRLGQPSLWARLDFHLVIRMVLCFPTECYEEASVCDQYDEGDEPEEDGGGDG